MVWAHRGSVAVVGVGYSAITRAAEAPLGVLTLTAIREALTDAGLAAGAVDGLATFPDAPFVGAQARDGIDVVTIEYVIRSLQLRNVSWYSQRSLGMTASALQDAVLAVATERCRYALVWRAMCRPPGRYGEWTAGVASGANQFSAPYGCVSPVQWHALKFRGYLETHGGDPEALADLAVGFRSNASENVHAVFRDRSLSREDYLAARMVSDPLRLYDCDVPVNGAVALLLCGTDRAADLRNPPARIAAVGQQAAYQRASIHYTLGDHIELGRGVAEQLWSDSGFGPGDMVAAQLYDGFSPTVLYWLEACGFCGRGEALALVAEGQVASGGRLPVNTFGGSLSEGRLHGMGHIAEAVLQVTGRARARQVSELGPICVFNGSPMLRGGGLVVTP